MSSEKINELKKMLNTLWEAITITIIILLIIIYIITLDQYYYYDSQ